MQPPQPLNQACRESGRRPAYGGVHWMGSVTMVAVDVNAHILTFIMPDFPV
jgi:hypothetical protein